MQVKGISAPTKHEVQDWIYGCSIVNPSSGYIWFDAGNYVNLVPGFETQITASTSFEAFIDGCGGNRRVIAPASTDEVVEIKHGFLLYPNPTKGSISLDINLDKATDVQFFIVDQLGRTMQEVTTGALPEGKSTFNVDVSSFASGTYFGVMRKDGTATTQKFVIQN